MAQESGSALGDEAGGLLLLAELEARRAGSREVQVRHLALVLAEHGRWGRPFSELALSPERLRAALMEDAGKGGEALPHAAELADVLKRAEKLVNSRREAMGGGHLLRAILEGKGAVAQAVARESGVELADLLSKPELLGLPVRLGYVQGIVQRIGLALRRLGHWTVLAFAWSAVSAFVLFFVARWLLGPERGSSWFPWLVLIIGAACALGLAANRAWRTYQRRKQAHALFAPRPAKPPEKPSEQHP